MGEFCQWLGIRNACLSRPTNSIQPFNFPDHHDSAAFAQTLHISPFDLALRAASPRLIKGLGVGGQNSSKRKTCSLSLKPNFQGLGQDSTEGSPRSSNTPSRCAPFLLERASHCCEQILVHQANHEGQRNSIYRFPGHH